MPLANQIIRSGQSPQRSGTNGIAKAITPDYGLNKLERSYRDHLEFRKRAGEIRDYRVHPFKLYLGDRCYYEIDFLRVENDDTLTVIETKGFERDDAIVKFKTAKTLYPFFRYEMVKWIKGEWVVTRT